MNGKSSNNLLTWVNTHFSKFFPNLNGGGKYGKK